MRILNLYIARKLLFTTLATVGVLTFAMVAGNLIKLFDLLARGVSPANLGWMMLLTIPSALNYTIPFAVLCAVILVFSRLSADHEITAMRATGVGIWQIVSPALLLGAALSACCLWLQMDFGPRCRWQFDQIREGEGARNPLAVVEAGRFVELPGFVIYASRREDNRLFDLHVYKLGKNGRVVQDITAREGDFHVDEEKQEIELVLNEALIVAADPDATGDAAKSQRVTGKTMRFPLNYGEQLNRKDVTRRLKYLQGPGIMGLIHAYSERGIETTPLHVELHRRMSMALSPFAFVLIGIPFGIRTRRSEAAIGIVISLGLATLFYTFLILADSLRHQALGPIVFLVWLPNIVYQLGGVFALARIAHH